MFDLRNLYIHLFRLLYMIHLIVMPRATRPLRSSPPRSPPSWRAWKWAARNWSARVIGSTAMRGLKRVRPRSSSSTVPPRACSRVRLRASRQAARSAASCWRARWCSALATPSTRSCSTRSMPV